MVRVGVLWKFRPEEMTEMEQIAEFECTKPRLKVIYEHSNPADPEAMLVMRGRTKVGYINADDKRWLTPLMEKSRRGVMIDFDHVVRHPDGESAVLKYRVTVDEDAIRPRLASTDWDSWRYPFAQLDTTESMDALDYAFEELLGIIEGADDAAMSLEECVDMLCENCRYDLSCETSERLDACCFALESQGQLALLDRLEATSTHRRGRRGVEEWRTWFNALVHSSRAKRLVQLYKNEVRIRLGVNRVTRQQMSLDLLALEQALFALPGQLFLYIDDPAQLMHMAFYRHIPEVKQLELLSALVLRELLKEATYEVAIADTEDETSTCIFNSPQVPVREPAALFTPEAMELWRKLQEADLVDEDFQPKMSMRKASIVASLMGSRLGLVPLWKPFEELWEVKELSNTFSHAQIGKYYGDMTKSVNKALG